LYSFELMVNGDIVKEWPGKHSGLALIGFQSVALDETLLVTLVKKFTGKFDPVLHKREEVVAQSSPVLPCPTNKENCPYCKSNETEFYSTVRKTALRTEVFCPADRCGYLLKPSCIGGNFFDYHLCIHKVDENA